MFPKRCALHNVLFLVIILSLNVNAKIALSQEAIILKVILNKEDKGEFFLMLTPDNDIWIDKDDLNNMGLQEGLGRNVRFAQETYVSLRSIPDLTFRIDKEEVCLHVTADPSLFKKQSIDASYEIPYKVIFTKDSSAFLNYALTYDSNKGKPSFDISGELGVSVGDYLGLTTFAYSDSDTDNGENFVRLMTNLTFNDRVRLRTAIFGDFPALSGILGSRVLLGGINFSKNFSIDPYLLRFPALNLRGILESPSDVEVYLDDLLVRKESLSPGEFLLADVPATVGLGTARIHVTDAYGRERIIVTPYYYSNRLLKRGFHEYSYSIGFVREDFGEKSFSYTSPAFMSFHSVGFTDYLTAGYTAEASKDLINIGPTASLLFSNFGVLEGALALSDTSGKFGYSGFIGYSFQSKNIGLRISLQSNSKEYSNLTMKPTDDKAKIQFSSVAGFGTKDLGYLTAEYSSSDRFMDTDTSTVALSYNKTLTKNTTLFVTARETKDVTTEDEIFLGLHIYLGKGISGNISYTSRKGKEEKRVGVRKSLPVGSGYGYRVDAGSFNNRIDFDGNLQYQNSYGIYEAGYHSREEDEGYRLSVSSGLGYIDRSVFFSRPIHDSFAKVKVGNLEGVRVYHYGNEVGRTSKNGYVIVPNLRSFLNNKIDIENRDIPIHYTIPELTKYISPPFRSGTLVKFDVSKMQGIEGTITIVENGKEIPMESAVMLIQIKGKMVEGLVGRDGEFYLENIPAGKHPGEILYRGRECKFDIMIPESEDIVVDVGKVFCVIKE